MKRRRRFMERLRRDLRYRLIIPLKRSRHSPEYTARGVSVGLFWALTPTVGVQMACVGVHWIISRRYFNRDFSVIAAMAWTWLTNVFTLLPFYYLFYVTGQVILLRDDTTGYRSFVGAWDKTMESTSGTDMPFSELLSTWGSLIVEDWFAAMTVGCVPYAVIGGWLGYRWSLAMVTAYRRRRLSKAQSAE